MASSQPNGPHQPKADDLLATQKLLRATLDASRDMIQVFEAERNEQGEIIDFKWILNNHESEKIYGDVVGKSLLQRQPGVVEEGIFEAFKQVVETGEPQQYEKRYVHEQFDGWFHQSVVKLNDGVVTTTSDITSRRKTEQEILRLNDEAAQKVNNKYLTLFNAIYQGFALCELIRDANGQGIDHRILELNPAFEQQTGISMQTQLGRTAREAFPTLDRWWTETYTRLVDSGEPMSFEHYFKEVGRWYEIGAYPMQADQFAVLYNDITERKREEQQQAFLLYFSDALRAQTKGDAIALQALQLLAEQLQLDRCYIAAYQLADDRADITHQVGNNRLPPMPEYIRLSDFPDAFQIVLEGTLVINDVSKTEGLTALDRQNMRALGFSALVAATLRQGEQQPLWVIVAVSASPRRWEPAEIKLIEEVTERTWAAVERAKAEDALRESEQQKVLLLQVSDLIQNLTQPTKLQEKALQLLGVHLGLSRAYLYRAEGEGQGWYHVIESAYQQEPGQPSMIGRHSLHPFGSWLFDGLEQGQVVEVSDVTAISGLSQAELAIYRGIGVAAFLNIPLLRQGAYAAGIAVHSPVPRNWKPTEIALIREVALRIWAAVERARAEEALKESEAKYRTIFNSIEEGFSLLDIQFDASGEAYDVIIRDANPAQDRIDGVRALIGKRVREMLPDIEMKWIERYAEIARTGEGAHFEDWSEANQRWYEVNASRIGGPGSTLVAIVYNDITDRKKADEGLKEASRRKDEFLAMLAHELRNPLAPIRNGLQLLAQIQGDDPVLSTILPVMNRQMDHLLRMVDDLLDVSRISRGKIDLQKQRIDLVQLVSQAVDAMHPLYLASGRQLTVQLPTIPIDLDGDATRLNQVVTNLLTNGLRYTREGGQVWLTLEQSGEQAILRVHDNGIGLAADQLEVIFELFVQVNKSLARSNSGLGLGLSLVQQLVQLHGGRVEAHSQGLEQGSEFVVYLPILTA